MEGSTKSKDKIIPILMAEFRKMGFVGLSLAQISEATGLGKASLYHHFPGGKDQMAQEVMRFIQEWVQKEIVDVLTSHEDPKERLKNALKHIDTFYESGRASCLLEIMGGGTSPKSTRSIIHETFLALVRGFQKLAIDCGKTPAESKKIAEDAIIGIQGSLILSRATDDHSAFQRQLKAIRLSIFE